MGEKGKAVGKDTATMQILLSIGFPEILCRRSRKISVANYNNFFFMMACNVKEVKMIHLFNLMGKLH